MPRKKRKDKRSKLKQDIPTPSRSYISVFTKLFGALNILSYLPKVNADEIYALLGVHYQLSYDRFHIRNFANKLMQASQNLTIFANPQVNYTQIASLSCAEALADGINIDVSIDSNITPTPNITASMLNVTMQVLNKECADSATNRGLLIAAVTPIGMLLLLGCCLGVYNSMKKASNKDNIEDAKNQTPEEHKEMIKITVTEKGESAEEMVDLDIPERNSLKL